MWTASYASALLPCVSPGEELASSLDDVPANTAELDDAELRTHFNKQQVKDAESYLSQTKTDLETAKAISEGYDFLRKKTHIVHQNQVGHQRLA